MTLKFAAAVLLFCGISPFRALAGNKNGCMENVGKENIIELAGKFSADSLGRYILNYTHSIHWINSGSRYFWYTAEYRLPEHEMHGSNVFSIRKYFLADTKSGKKRQMFDNGELIDAINKLLPEGDRIQELKIWEFDFNPMDINEVEFDVNKTRFRYNLASKELSIIPCKERKSLPGMGGDYYKNWSADSLYYVSAIDDDIWLYRTAPETDGCGRTVTDSIRMSVDGEHYYSFSYSGYGDSPAEGYGSVKGNWIGKTHKFLAFREDKRLVGTLSLVNSLAKPRPTVKTYKFPMPGDKDVIQYEAFIVDADNSSMTRLGIDRYKDQQLIVPRFAAFPHTDSSAWVLRLNRSRDSLDLCRIDAGGYDSVKTIISENCSPHLNEQLFSYHIINDGKEILWWSERSGKGRWYLYDGDGRLKNAISDNDFVAGSIVKIDTAGRSIIFEGYGREKGTNPHYRFYYKASIDGKGKTISLTGTGNGNHNISFSPDGKMLFDSYSRMDMAPRHRICDMKGNVVMELEPCDLSILHEKGWTEPEVAEFTAADSVTKLYGIVYLPFNIEPGRKYPIVSNVYPGPQTDLVPQSFTLDDNFNQSLAQLGFIVVNVSYRGSCPVRGKDFYTYGYGNLRDYALEDDHAVICQVAERYPFADIDRVGIYGHSGGGFMAAAAMLTRPEFYKVGIAASGNHDNNIYTQWWGETFHGVTRVTDEAGNVTFRCDIPTNMELAGNLQGKLLLITGDMDDNVHPASTLRLAKALIDANKRFDMMIIPGADHGIESDYYVNLIRYYFVENLSGVHLDDIDIVNHK